MNAPVGTIPTTVDERLTAYRPYIDGLRAISILSVVAFHVGVPGFSGGYVGVDIFFVISGFLILSQIIEAMDERRFSFAGFWARRALRILPPYLLVIVAVALVAPFILIMPDDLTDFGRQVTYSAGMIVNHLFLLQQGYFDAPAETKVLLNLWSLSVEEQFYLFAPPFMAVLYVLIRRSQRSGAREGVLLTSTAIVFLVSLVACIALSAGPGSRNPAFYLTPLRAWEFAAGCAIGLILPYARRLSQAAQSILAPAGLVAIGISVFAFSAELSYPGAYALLPVLGSSAVILGGMLYPQGVVVRLLSISPMVMVGLLSYSWYLWHWPLISFDRVVTFGEHNLLRDLLNALVSFGLAGLTYIAVERPIRRLRKAASIRLTWRPVIAGVAASAVVAAAGWYGFQSLASGAADAVPPRYSPAFTSAEPVCDLQLAKSAADCLVPAAGRPLGLIIGDSMLLSPRDVIVRAAQASNSFVLSYISAGCGALLGVDIFVYDQDMQQKCFAMRAGGAKVLAELQGSGKPPRYALLFSNWPAYVGGRGAGALGIAGSGVPAPDQQAFFIEALRNTVRILNEAGVERVLIIGPTPAFPRAVPACLALADRFGADPEKVCSESRQKVDAVLSSTATLMLQALAGLPAARFIDPIDEFCDAELCRPWAGGDVLLIDNGHLSNAGLQRIVDAHAGDFAWLLDAGD